MNIIIFDNLQQVCQFEASETWFLAFMLDERFFDKDPKVQQAYIEEELKTKKKLVVEEACIQSDIFTAPLNDVEKLDNSPITTFTPSEEEWNIAVIDCKRKKIIYIEEDFRFNLLDSAVLEIGLSAKTNYKKEYLHKIKRLIDLEYLGLDFQSQSYEHVKSFTSLKNGLAQYVEDDNDISPAAIELKDSEVMYRLKINPNKTGWNITIAMFDDVTGDDTQVQNVVRLIYEAGVLLSQSHIQAWKEFYTLRINPESSLNIDYITVERERKLLYKTTDIQEIDILDKRKFKI